jgi:hypothetical protein
MKLGGVDVLEYCLVSHRCQTLRRGVFAATVVRIDLGDSQLTTIPSFLFSL